MRVTVPKESYPQYYVEEIVGHKPKYNPTHFLVQYDDELQPIWEEAWHFIDYDDKGDDPIYTDAFHRYCIENKIPLEKVTVSKDELQSCLTNIN